MSAILGAVKDFVGDLTGIDNDDPRLEQMMRKALPLCLLFVTGMIFYNYKVETMSCMKHTNDIHVTDEFYHGFCWAKGIFLFRELMLEEHADKNGVAIGLPKKMDEFQNDKELCRGRGRNAECMNVSIVYYRQHHWLYQVLFGISIAMALPYCIHLMTNNDLVSMQIDMVKYQNEDKKMIRVHEAYFSDMDYHLGNTLVKLFGDLMVKVSYLLIGILMFAYLNKAFEYRFGWYVIDLYHWMVAEHDLNITVANAHKQNIFMPGDKLLPVMGICKFINAPYETRTENKGLAEITTVCEMNSNKLAQYWMVYVWFIMVGYIIVAVLNTIDYIKQVAFVLLGQLSRCFASLRRKYGKKKRDPRRDVKDHLTVRQIFLLKSLKKSHPEFAATLSDRIIDTHSLHDMPSPSCPSPTTSTVSPENTRLMELEEGLQHRRDMEKKFNS